VEGRRARRLEEFKAGAKKLDKVEGRRARRLEEFKGRRPQLKMLHETVDMPT